MANQHADMKGFDFHAGILTTDGHGVKPRGSHAAIRE
jgi:hypothetical protein